MINKNNYAQRRIKATNYIILLYKTVYCLSVHSKTLSNTKLKRKMTNRHGQLQRSFTTKIFQP